MEIKRIMALETPGISHLSTLVKCVPGLMECKCGTWPTRRNPIYSPDSGARRRNISPTLRLPCSPCRKDIAGNKVASNHQSRLFSRKDQDKSTCGAQMARMFWRARDRVGTYTWNLDSGPTLLACLPVGFWSCVGG